MLQANVYNMQYNNQLVLNGKVNDVGAYTRVNVDNSYRRGVELEAVYAPVKYVSIGGNVTLSQNKILEFRDFVDDYDNGIQIETVYKNKDIAFSPNFVSSANVTFKPLKSMEIAFINKYVGRQFLDNTQNEKRSINPYNVLDLRLNYSLFPKGMKQIDLMFTVCNLLNNLYETNGYTYSYIWGGQLSTFNFLAPAAPRHFMGGVVLKF